MMRVLFDSNVIIDAISRREGANEYSRQILLMAARGELNGVLLSKQITDICYALRKHIHDKTRIRDFASFLIRAFDIIPFTVADISGGLQFDGRDIEDDMLTAACMNNGIELILSADTKDFTNSEILCMTPEEYIRSPQ